MVKVVSKNVCKSRYKCKSNFKSDFVEFGEKGCEREFSFIKPNDKNKQDKKSNEDKIQPLLRKRDGNILYNNFYYNMYEKCSVYIYSLTWFCSILNWLQC